MICKNCQAEIKEDAEFCPVCGARVSPKTELEKAGYNAEAKSVRTPFILSILALFFCEAIPVGLVLSIISLVLIVKYKNAGGDMTGKARAAYIISIIALVASIVSVFLAAFSVDLIFTIFRDILVGV